jgi:hypothetical protein
MSTIPTKCRAKHPSIEALRHSRAEAQCATVRDGVAATRPKRVLAISSGGGHWVELLRLRPAFTGDDVVYVTVSRKYQVDVAGARFYVVPDATRWNPARLVSLCAKVAWVLLRERPTTVVSTGAAPGYFALRIAKWFGIRTVWVDSIANADELSLSGSQVREYADLWLTQWPHLAGPHGPHYQGGVF